MRRWALHPSGRSTFIWFVVVAAVSATATTIGEPILLLGPGWAEWGSDYGTSGTGTGPTLLLGPKVPVGSWQAWQVPRLSIFRRRLFADTRPSG